MRRFFEKTFGGTEKEFFEVLESRLVDNKKFFVVTANPETFMTGSKSCAFRNLLLDRETTIVPDGIGVVKAMSLLGIPVSGRIPGVQITEKLFELGNNHNKRLCILGSKQKVLDDLRVKLVTQYPNLEICSLVNGYEDNKQEKLKEMAELSPDIVLVALGVPMQELLIYECMSQFEKGIFVGVGGSLDVVSGNKQRAPKIFIRLNLEWLYRIAKEPHRIKRFLNSNVKYIFAVLNLVITTKSGDKND